MSIFSKNIVLLGFLIMCFHENLLKNEYGTINKSPLPFKLYNTFKYNIVYTMYLIIK